MDEKLLNDAIDGTSYGRNSAHNAMFKLGQANMFLGEFFSRRDETGLVSAARDNLAEARKEVDTTVVLLEQAERALSPLHESDPERLHRTTVNFDVLKAIPQQPQTQVVLNDQLRALEMAARRLGLYDAADFVRNRLA